MAEPQTEIAGWRWTMAAGCVPLAAGLFMLLATQLSFANPEDPWSFVLHQLDFSFGQLAAVDPQAGPLVVLLADLGSVNIVAAALAVVLISRFALRTGERWAWWYLLFSLVWVGFNDAWGVTRFYLETGAPMLVMPLSFCTLMAIGLFKSGRQLFGR